MKYCLTLFFALLSLNAFSIIECSMEFYPTTIYLENPVQMEPETILKSSSCNSDIQKRVIGIISNYNTKLNSRYVENLISEQIPNHKVNVFPDNFNFVDFKNYLNHQVALSSGNKIIKANILNNAEIIKLEQGESLKIVCDDCGFPGNKNIKMLITNSKTNKSHLEWINAMVATKVKVLLANKNLNVTNHGLQESDFRIDYIYAIKPEIYFSSLEEVSFHRLTQPLSQDSAIKNMDIMPLDLVKSGQPSQVIFEKEGLFLSGTAIPLRNAKYNEIIKLQRDNNRHITGRVIDYNKVKVEL